MRGSAAHGLEHGAVAIDGDGLVTGYTGDLYCVACGRQWVPQRERLRRVE